MMQRGCLDPDGSVGQHAVRSRQRWWCVSRDGSGSRTRGRALVDLSGNAFQILAPGEGVTRQVRDRSGQAVRQADPAPGQGHPGDARKALRVGEVRRRQAAPLRTETTPARRAGNRARQPRHPAHLRRNARRRDVRLRLGGGRGSRPAARTRPRAGVRGRARASPASTRSACCSRAARSRRARKRSTTSPNRRKSSKKRVRRANRSSQTSKTGSKGSTPTRQRRRARRLKTVTLTDAIAGLRLHRLDLRQRRRRRSRQLRTPRRTRGKARHRRRRQGSLPRPARGQRSRSADDGDETVPLRRGADRPDAGRGAWSNPGSQGAVGVQKAAQALKASRRKASNFLLVGRGRLRKRATRSR